MPKCEKCGVEFADGQEHKCATQEQPAEQPAQAQAQPSA